MRPSRSTHAVCPAHLPRNIQEDSILRQEIHANLPWYKIYPLFFAGQAEYPCDKRKKQLHSVFCGQNVATEQKETPLSIAAQWIAGLSFLFPLDDLKVDSTISGSYGISLVAIFAW